MKPQNTVLLEQLAATSWFAEHGEVTLTSGLAFCLEKDSDAAGGFMELLRQHTGHTAQTLPVPEVWRTELADDRRNRVDLAGLVLNEEGQAPVLFLEAKVSAEFAPQQVSGYVQTQQHSLRLAGAEAGVMVVLVPEERRRAAGEEIALDLARLDVTTNDSCWIVSGGPAVTVCVISWDSAIDAMLQQADSAACDLEQLRGACRALRGADVSALTEGDLVDGWRDRSDDLRLIIDRVTRQVIAELSLPLAPWQPNASGGLAGGFRYLAPDDLPNLAVGLRLDERAPPLWVRWHKDTPDFAAVPSRLAAAGYTTEKHEGHLWLPLQLAPDVGSATHQIENLVAQVVKLHKTAIDWSNPV